MKRLCVDKTKCSMCGACLAEGTLLKELDDGTIELQGSGILQPSQEQAANAVAELCSEHALFIVEQEVDVSALKSKIRQPLVLDMPAKSLYSFQKSDYHLPVLSGRGEYQYKYSSDNKAEREGLSDFRDNIWGQRKAIAQQVIISYKHDKMMPFLQYEEKSGNYKYDTIQRLSGLLKSYVDELEAGTGQKISLRNDFYDFKAKDSSVLKDVIKYGIDNGWADRIASECEPYDWFDSWIDSDYTTRMKVVHHIFGDDDYEDEDVYCYKLSNASKKLNEQILDECQNCIPEMSEQQIESEIRMFHEALKKEWDAKICALV